MASTLLLYTSAVLVSPYPLWVANPIFIFLTPTALLVGGAEERACLGTRLYLVTASIVDPLFNCPDFKRHATTHMYMYIHVHVYVYVYVYV